MCIAKQIHAYFQENFFLRTNTGDLADDASLSEAGVVDSTGILEVVLFLEETFGIKVPDEEILPENFDSIQQMARYAKYKMNGAAAT
jgi:acyl carrier protein